MLKRRPRENHARCSLCLMICCETKRRETPNMRNFRCRRSCFVTQRRCNSSPLIESRLLQQRMLLSPIQWLFIRVTAVDASNMPKVKYLRTDTSNIDFLAMADIFMTTTQGSTNTAGFQLQVSRDAMSAKCLGASRQTWNSTVNT